MAEDRCVMCCAIFTDAPSSRDEIAPALTDAQLLDIVHKSAQGDRAVSAWLDQQWCCAECLRDLQAHDWVRLFARRRRQQQHDASE